MVGRTARDMLVRKRGPSFREVSRHAGKDRILDGKPSDLQRVEE